MFHSSLLIIRPVLIDDYCVLASVLGARDTELEDTQSVLALRGHTGLGGEDRPGIRYLRIPMTWKKQGKASLCVRSTSSYVLFNPIPTIIGHMVSIIMLSLPKGKADRFLE